MPYGDPDPQDPNVLVGVSVPVDRRAVREMAYAFAEEFASLGYGERRLLAIFRQPFYGGPHRAYALLGEEEIRAIVAESVAVWGRVRAVVRVPEPPPAAAPLVQIGGAGREPRETRQSCEEGDR